MKSNIFLSLLKELGVPHTRSYSRRVYEEHPYKYTFFGLKSLSEKYGIKCNGIKLGDKEEVSKLSVPFVADYGNDYVLVKEIEDGKVKLEMYDTDLSVSVEDFNKSWGGNALLFYPDENSVEPDYRLHKRNDLLSLLEKLGLGICLVILLTVGFLQRNVPSIMEYPLIGLSLLGMAFSAMLLSSQMRFQNSLVESVCHAFKQANCNNVLESKAAKLLGRYSWAEIGFSYFAANFLLSLLSSNYVGILAYIGALALIYSVWSVYYQKRISQWCLLCLMVQGVIIVQFVLYLIGGYYVKSFEANWTDFVCLFTTYIAIGIATNKLLPLLTKSEELLQSRWQFNYFKLNKRIFNALAESGNEFPPCNSSILFGNPESEIKLTVFSNPYCNPCSAMHRRLQRLIDENIIQIQYVFTSFKPEWNNINKFMIAVYHQLGAEEAWKIYSQWYDKGRFEQEKFFDRFRLKIDAGAVEKEFDIQEKWGKEADLHATPTLIVNDHKIPYGYSVEDLAYVG